MRVSRQQMTAKRERLLDIASRLFRERGFDDVSVVEIMQEAGLTHGGFYGHFASKEALAAEVATYALLQMTNRWRIKLENSGTAGLERLVDSYLSQQHRDCPGIGCAIAALGPEVARQPDTVRNAFAAELESLIGGLSGFLPGADPSERRKRALALMAQLVGAIVLARASGRSALSSEILDIVRGAVVLSDSATAR